jgi:P pilus assembly chaperone PapD
LEVDGRRPTELHIIVTGFVMRITTIATILLIALATAGTAYAMGFQPMDMEMTSAGAGARTQFYVSNDSAVAVAVEITVDGLSYTEDGKQVTKEVSGNDLLILPATASIPPGATQTFRVQWVGDPEIKASQSFMVHANQMPVRDTSGKSRIQVVQGFGAILNVAPANGAADLKLLSAAPAKGPKGGPALSILVENPTNTHALIANTALHAGSQTIGPDTMRSTVGIGVVAPGKKRRFLVPLAAPVEAGATVTIDYRGKQ